MTRLIVALLFATPLFVFGQYQFPIKNHLKEVRYNSFLYKTENDAHTSAGAFRLSKLDSVISKHDQSLKMGYSSWIGRKAFDESLVEIKEKNYYLKIDPIVNFQFGQDLETGDNKYVNSRGYILQGSIGNKFSFFSSFTENQAILPDYVNRFIELRNVFPGQGFARIFKEDGYDFSFPAGEISYYPSDIFSFTLGQGKNFFGEGYRSMLLSDAAFSYPFFRIQTEFWKIKYVNIWGQLYDVRNEVSPNNIFAKKFFASHYLSININSRWNVSLFESVILSDSSQERGLDASFFNPVIFYRPIEFATGSGAGNALLGLGSSYKIMDELQVYGQFILDEFTFSQFFSNSGYWGNKYAVQLGFKYHNAFNIKGLFARLEYNMATPYTYSHAEVLRNYAHYGQSLAHPWGANFRESLFHIYYTKNRWEFEARFHYGKLGLDTLGSNWGSNIYESYETRESDFGNSTGQGVDGTLNYLYLRAGWLINPKSGLKVEAGMQFRDLSAPSNNFGPVSVGKSNYIFLGLRTEFFNQYLDF